MQQCWWMSHKDSQIDGMKPETTEKIFGYSVNWKGKQ